MAKPKMNEEKDDIGGFEEDQIPKVAKKPLTAIQPYRPKESEGYFEGPNKAFAPRIDPSDPTGLKILPARAAGYLNQHGIFFPAGFKLKGGHVGFRGNVTLSKCPKCGHRNPASEAVKGHCTNDKANEGNGCRYSAVSEIEAIEQF